MNRLDRPRRHLPTARWLRRSGLVLLLALLPASTLAAPRPGGVAVEKAMAASTREGRIQALERALNRATDEASALWITLNLAEQLRLDGDARAARKAFKTPKKAGGDYAIAASLGIALAELAEGKDSMSVLRGAAEKPALDTMNADRFAMLARAADRDGKTAEAAELAKKALSYAASDPGVERRLQKALAKTGKAAPQPDQTPGDNAGEAPGRLDALDRAIAAGDRSKVASVVAELRASAGDDADLKAAADYAERRIGLTADPRTIAVLMPASGKYRAVGKQLRSALEQGWGSGGGGRRLVFLDTGENEASAIAAMERAVFELRAVAVVGPVRSELADPVARIAEATRTPLLGLHQDGTAADDRPWTMDGLATPEAQVEGLVAHVMGKEGMKSFAIFAPDTPYGQDAANAFTAAVQARGGKVTVREHYDKTATDLIPFAKKLGRKDYKARASEWRAVKSKIEAAGGDPSRAVLPPIIDFDAIFVPDGWRRIPVASAALAYEEFPVGDFQITKGSRTYPLLGLSGWNNEQLVTTGGPYVRNSRFVDVFSPDAAASREFAQSYKAATGKAPSTLEAQVWTVGRVLGTAARADADTRSAFRTALLQAETPRTATGARTVQPDSRRIDHEVTVFTLNKNGIRPITTSSGE